MLDLTPSTFEDFELEAQCGNIVPVVRSVLADLQTPDVLEELDAAAQSDLLWRLVDSLPPCQADLIRRAFVSGQTHQEIADQTGLPLGTVKSRIRLGLEKLRFALSRAATLESIGN